MDHQLRSLFDYQRFDPNPLLASLIADTCSRYRTGAAAVSDDDAALVAAAGSPVQSVQDPEPEKAVRLPEPSLPESRYKDSI